MSARFLVLSGLLLLVAALVACSDSSAVPSPAAEPATASTDAPATPSTTAASAAQPTDAPPDDQTIRLARATWTTGWFQAEVYKDLLQELGYTVVGPEPIDQDAFFTTELPQGSFDLWANGWFPNNDHRLRTPGIQGTITPLGSQMRGGGLQGYFIDQATATEHSITNLEALADPEIAALFDQDGNGKADLIGCAQDWVCHAVIEHQLDAFGLRETVEHLRDDYDMRMLDAFDRYQLGEAILFYTWTPNWPLGALVPGEDVVWLEVPFPSLPERLAGQEDFTIVPELAGCASDPCSTGFPVNDIRVVANTAFLERHPDVRRLLELVAIPLDDVTAQNATMFFGEDSAEDIERQAEDWIRANRTQVDAWQAAARTWQEGNTLERVRARGTVRCGLQNDLPGFGFSDNNTDFRGFNADMCRVVAAAVFSDANAVEFVPLSIGERFAALNDRRVDVLFHNTAWLAERDVGMDPPNSGIRVAFGPIIFHDGQRLMVPNNGGINALPDLAGKTICVHAGSSTEENLIAQFANRGIDFTLKRLDAARVYDDYERGGCDAVTGDTSELVARRAGFVNPGAHSVLSEPISREPHSPAFREDDAQWGDIVSWAVNATIYAEELGITSENVEVARTEDDPDKDRLLGEQGQIGAKLGLANNFAYTIIQQVGNYREIYNRSLGPDTALNLERGPNKTWNSVEGPGGLLSAPPFR